MALTLHVTLTLHDLGLACYLDPSHFYNDPTLRDHSSACLIHHVHVYHKEK